MDLQKVQANLELLAQRRRLIIRHKGQWWFAKILNVLRFWDSGWNERASVLGRLALLPDPKHAKSSITQILWMTYVLARASDDVRYGPVPVWVLSSFPQLLAVPSLLSILSIWCGLDYLSFLVLLVFALPWPAPGRLWIQMRAYSMFIAAHHWLLKTPVSLNPEELQHTFSGTINRMVSWGYYKMAWNRKKVVTQMARRLKYGGTLSDTAQRIKKALTQLD